MKRAFFEIVFFLLLGALFLRSPVAGAVVQNIGDLHLEYDDPMFPSSDIWAPGKTVTKSVVVGNLSGDTAHTTGMESTLSKDSILADALTMKVMYGLTGLWGPGTLREFINAGEISLTEIGPGGSVAYDLTVFMNSSLGNEYQGEKTVLDFIFGFITTPTATPTPVPGDGGTDGGGTGGVSPSSCSAVAPGAPQNLTVSPGGAGEVVLSWQASSGTATHYLVAYGPNSGGYLYGNPNVGNVLSYTVSGLSSGVGYFFVVKGVNDCAPGPYSNEATGIAGGVVGEVVVSGPGAGFEVLGETQEAVGEGELGGGISAESGETAGAVKQKICFWWLVLSLLALLMSWAVIKKTEKPTRRHLAAVALLALLAFLGDRLAHRWFFPSRYCSWMWLWSLLVFLFGFWYWRRKKA